MNKEFWRGKKVLITGANGFKGSWLTKWLDLLGAQVTGISLEPDECNIYNDLKFSNKQSHIIGDITDIVLLREIVESFQPEIVFHLAAQAIVREAVFKPIETFSTNVMGTANLLEVVRQSTSPPKSIVVITSDKVYKNIEMYDFYKEENELGGDEPYSASKACEELVVTAYREAFLKEIGIGVATARASNIFGGGDHHFDRLIPYLVKTIFEGDKPKIRNPLAIRPWQYILDVLRGYIILAEKLYKEPKKFAEAWNFGPKNTEVYTVQHIVDKLLKAEMIVVGKSFKEANLLMIDTKKSYERLGWEPIYSLKKGMEHTCGMYHEYFRGVSINKLMNEAIYLYEKDLEV